MRGERREDTSGEVEEPPGVVGEGMRAVEAGGVVFEGKRVCAAAVDEVVIR